jgi:hypothetical protein
VALVPIHPVTTRTAWLVGQIEGQEAAKGNVLPFNLLIAAAGSNQATPFSPTTSDTFRNSAAAPSASRIHIPVPYDLIFDPRIRQKCEIRQPPSPVSIATPTTTPATAHSL